MAVTVGAGDGSLKRGEFRGSASEYFGIWIVNILLTIITLGIYSAWAKVRRNRYFFGNTFVDGYSFDYHARGLQILIGRLIVLAILIATQMATIVFPPAGLITPILFLLALPWLMARGLRFSARVTSYRNIRFDFTGTPWGAFKSIILGSFVAFVSLGILAPLASRWMYRYILNNLRYGDRRFDTDPAIGKLYRVWILPALIVVVGSFLAVGIGIAIWALIKASGASDETTAGISILAPIFAIAIPYFVLTLVAGIFYRIGVRNVVMKATLLDGRHRLFSDMGRLRYFWIVVSNLVVAVLTFGLMRPWAAVRERRYVVEHAGIIPDGAIGAVVAAIEREGAAATAEYLDMEGFDFGF